MPESAKDGAEVFSGAQPRVDGISIIIPTYNGTEWVLNSLHSVLSQECSVPLEVVVVDDCSTDQTIEIVRSINDARISFHSTGKNSGVAAARNLGIQHAKYEWIAFNDQDDVWCSGRLVKQLDILERDSTLLGVAGGAARLAADGQSIWTGRFLGFSWTPSLKLTLSDPPYYNPITDGVSYLQTLIVRKEIACKAGGFLESLPLADDVDFAMKIARFGRFGWVTEPVFLYRLGHHNQTAPSVAKAKTLLAAHAYVYAAHAARSAGSEVPDVSEFMLRFQPTKRQVIEFDMRQQIRLINTVWVNLGLFHALLTGFKVAGSSPVLFFRMFADRMRHWSR